MSSNRYSSEFPFKFAWNIQSIALFDFDYFSLLPETKNGLLLDNYSIGSLLIIIFIISIVSSERPLASFKAFAFWRCF